MKYNTGKASHKISANEKFAYDRAWHKDQPSVAQKKLWGYLMARLTENNLDLGGVYMGRLQTRNDYANAIDIVKRYLIKQGILEKGEPTQWKKYRIERYEKMREERKNTKWISIKKKLPDRKYVKTLDADGNMYTLEWNQEYKVFVSEFGKPITKKNEKLHKYKVPIAWAYLED